MKVLGAVGHSRVVEDGDNPAKNVQALAMSQDFELLSRCRGGDAAAWRALHDAHFDFVWKCARRLGTPPAELDDVCQEAFLVAYRRLATFDEGRLSTWLYRITANIVSSRHRRRRVRSALMGLFHLDGGHEPILWRTPQHDVEARETEAQVAEVLASMAPKKREVFALFELENLSGEEIAERVGCNVATVWTRLHHARKDFERIARKRGYLS